MNGTSQARGVYIARYGSRFWITTIDTDPKKESILLGRVGNMFVCLFLFLVCLLSSLSVRGLGLVVVLL